jgi:hypothetical protein
VDVFQKFALPLENILSQSLSNSLPQSGLSLLGDALVQIVFPVLAHFYPFWRVFVDGPAFARRPVTAIGNARKEYPNDLITSDLAL